MIRLMSLARGRKHNMVGETTLFMTLLIARFLVSLATESLLLSRSRALS